MLRAACFGWAAWATRRLAGHDATRQPRTDVWRQATQIRTDSHHVAERLRPVVLQHSLPILVQDADHERVLLRQPREVPQAMLQHLRGSNGLRGAGGRRTRKLGSRDRDAGQIRRLVLRVDHNEAQHDGAPSSPPGGRVDQDRLAHQVARKPADDLDRVVLCVELDVPRIRAAWTRQLRASGLHAQDEDLHLDRPLDHPGLDGRRVAAQTGWALASTCSRVTFMLCDSPACFWSAGTISSSDPRTSNPHSHRTASRGPDGLFTAGRIGRFDQAVKSRATIPAARSEAKSGWGSW